MKSNNSEEKKSMVDIVCSVAIYLFLVSLFDKKLFITSTMFILTAVITGITVIYMSSDKKPRTPKGINFFKR